MKEKTRRIAAAAIAGLTTVSMLAGCGAADAAKLDGTKVVATIDGTEIPMGILSLATRYQQGNQEYMYNMYSSMYGMQMSPNWDSEYDAENDPGKTNGQNFVENVLDQLKVLYLSKAKAAEYGVELSEDLQTKAGEAAKAFMEANSEEAIELLGVTEDQVKEYLEMQAYVDLVEHAIRDEATVNVSDEEANQSSFSYVMINYDEPTEEEVAEETTEEASTEETADDAAAEETADDAAAEEKTEEDAAAEDAAAEESTEDAAAEETTEEDAAAEEATEEDAAAEETTEEDAAAEETTEEDAAAEETTEDADAEATEDTEEVTMTAEEKAQAIFDKMMEDPTQDMDEVAKSVDESLYGSTGHFRTAQTIGEDADVEVIDDAEGEAAAEEEAPAEDAAAEEETPADDAAAEEEAPAEDAATTEEETPAEDATAEEDVVESEEGEDIEAVDGEEYEETDDSGYPSVLINSLRGLEDGEMVAEVIDTGSAYYVARLDLVHDEESTQSTRESLENEQRSAHYEEVTTGWTDSCDFTADEEVLKTLVVSDAQKINIVYDQPEETGEETTEDAAAEETTEDAAAEETTEEKPAAEDTAADTAEEPAAEDTEADATEDTAADAAEEPAAEDTAAEKTEEATPTPTEKPAE